MPIGPVHPIKYRPDAWLEDPTLQWAVAGLAGVTGVDPASIDVDGLRRIFSAALSNSSIPTGIFDYRLGYSIEEFIANIEKKGSRREYDSTYISADYSRFLAGQNRSFWRPSVGSPRWIRNELRHRFSELAVRFGDSDEPELSTIANTIAHRELTRWIHIFDPAFLTALESLAVYLDGADPEKYEFARNVLRSASASGILRKLTPLGGSSAPASRVSRTGRTRAACAHAQARSRRPEALRAPRIARGARMLTRG